MGFANSWLTLLSFGIGKVVVYSVGTEVLVLTSNFVIDSLVTLDTFETFPCISLKRRGFQCTLEFVI